MNDFLETRIRQTSEHDGDCKDAKSFCINVKHDILLVQAVSSFKLPVPAGTAVFHRKSPDKHVIGNTDADVYCTSVNLFKLSSLSQFSLLQSFFDG
jgi:hypothetical protein